MDGNIESADYDDFSLGFTNDETHHISHSNSIDIDDDNLNISFHIPGAFKNNDMQIDDSPPFAIESELYFDSASHHTVQGNDLRRESMFPHNQYFNRQHFLNSLQTGVHSLNQNLTNATTPTPSSNLQFDTPTSTGQFVSYDNHYDNNSIYSAFINDNETSSFSNDHLRNASIDGNTPSLSINPGNPNPLTMGVYPNYDLSPLSTTTSLTPSVNSLQSNQPSFFSAHQYLPRPSVDIVSSHRNSLDTNSLASNPQLKRITSGRYLNFNSISNYIPFMNDKDKDHSRLSDDDKSPMSGGQRSLSSHTPPSLFSGQSQPGPRLPSKHLIKSIFKTNALSPNVASESDPLFESINEEYNTDFLMMSGPPHDGHDTMDPVEPVPFKKVKKSKRNLFTRFKTPVKEENEDIDDSSKSTNNSLTHEEDFDDNLPASMSRTPSSANTVRTNANQVINVNNADDMALNVPHQPDYAALFENVGKRKNKKVSKPSSSLSFTKTKLKAKDQLNWDMDGGTDIKPANLYDSELISLSTSNTSNSQNFLGMEINNEDTVDLEYDHEESSLAIASKRVLSSKLIKRKTTKKEADIKNVKTKVISEEGIEVEVDLKTLDIPDSQLQATSTVNSKSSIRGRKENKEADLTDLSKIYLCNYCSRRFKRQEHLKRHFRSLHTFEKPYDCDICHKKFSRSDNLNQHLKIHKQEEQERLKAQEI